MDKTDNSTKPATLQDWLDALEHNGSRPKANGRGFLAHCPAHDDSTPSLSIAPGDKVPVIATCFAGCEFEAIRAALGLTGDGAPRSAPPVQRKPAKPKKPQALPDNPFIKTYFYTTADGEIAFAVQRRTTPTGKTFSQWRPADGGLWLAESAPGLRPLYLLADIAKSTGRVAVVEGEKCVEAMREVLPQQPVTTWAGGADSWRRTDWESLAGREVSLLADADTPGRTAMTGIAEHLQGLGCKIKIGLPDGESGDDIADWLAIDQVAALKRVGELLQDYQPADPDADAGIPVTDSMADNPHFRILGLAGDAVAIRIRAGRILQRTRESLTQPATLISIAPLAYWARYTEADDVTSAHGRKLGDTLIREADQLGQIDISKIAGRGAARVPSGAVVYHLGDRIFADGREMPLDEDGQPWLAEPRLELPPPASAKELRTIADAVMAYRWATPDDGRRLLGWIVAAIVGGALEWRPHLLLTAPAAQGKSWLLRHVVERLMGELLIRIADATPAALARLTAHSSLPIAIDEAEPSSPWVLELLKLLRVSSGAEGLRVRADATTGGVVTQAPRFSALLSSTAAPMLQRADASRLTIIRFGPPVADWRKVSSSIQKAMAPASGVRGHIIRSTAQIVANADKLALEFQDRGMDSRESLAAAALTAGWHVWGVDKNIVTAQAEQTPRSDAIDALMAILALRFKIDPVETVSILELLTDERRKAQLADLYGIRLYAKNLAIATNHSGLAGALKRTQWERVDLRRLLLQIDGATESRNALNFARLRSRAVLIPEESLDQMGVSTLELFGQMELGDD